MVEELRERLKRQAFLFDDPSTYVAGVEDALAEVGELLAELETLHAEAESRSTEIVRPA